ncbi:MAG: pitrilysin family protein [Candidatus Woesearchaeota archaeon]|nr:pitrilysin family protein [Candidatus Woesearchaeota archaeon]
METFILKNGVKVVFCRRKTESLAIEVGIKVGSDNENAGNNGISHFLEHMLFEGTKKRTTLQIANEIESLGGDLNAATTNERTLVYVKLPKKHFEVALDVLSDIILNPIFDKKAIEKERKVILSEINLVNDEPRFYQWILFQKELFRGSQAALPTYGAVDIVKKLKRKDFVDYYKKHYVGSNIVISIVGDLENVKEKAEEYFSLIEKGVPGKRIEIKNKNKSSSITEKKHISHSYVVLGYKTVDRKSRESYVFDIIRAVLGRGQSGKLFDEIRTKRGLAYEVGVLNDNGIDHGFFSVYFNCGKENIDKIINITVGEFKKLQKLTLKELNEAKTFLEGEFIVENEDSRHYADFINFEQFADAPEDYIGEIRKVTLNDVKRTAGKYLNEDYVLAIVKQK